MKTKIRPLTDDEVKQLAFKVAIQTGNTEEESYQIILATTTVAIDNYISDGPGYFGTIYLVIGGEPGFYCLYDKDFTPIKQDESMNQ